MHVGLFFGSFNPVHIGHLALANYMLCFTDLEEIWFVVSPQNPFKEKGTLLEQNNRLHLVNLAVEDHPRMKASNIEFTMSLPSYTVNTLARLGEKHPQHRFSLIVGQDNLAGFSKWKNHEAILRNHHLYVYPRHGAAASEFDAHPHVHLTAAPVIGISSTFIRTALKNKKDIRYFLHPKVWEEIEAAGYYGS